MSKTADGSEPSITVPEREPPATAVDRDSRTQNGTEFSIFQTGAPGLKERGLSTGRKHEASRPGRKPT